MATQQSTKETGKSKAKSKKLSDPVAMIKEVTALKESPAASFPPDVIELAVDQIASNQAATARNLSRAQLEESQQDLERLRQPTAPPQPQPTGGLFGQGQHPLIAMIDQIPKEERLKFIENNKSEIFGSVEGTGTNPQLAALLHKDDNGKDRPSAATDMASMLLALSQMQTNNMKMFMDIQQFQKPATTGPTDGMEKMMALTLQQIKTMQENMVGQKEETAAQIYALQQENMQMQREQMASQMESIAAQHSEEIQQMRKAIENKDGQVTRGDLASLIEQANQVAGVKFSAETAEDARIRNEHLLEMEKLKMEGEQLAQAHEAQLAAAAAKQQQWNAIAAVAAPFVDVMRLKKAVQGGGSPSARALANRISD